METAPPAWLSCLDELGEPVGARVGYQVRFEDVSSPRTRIRFVTEGVASGGVVLVVSAGVCARAGRRSRLAARRKDGRWNFIGMIRI